MGTTFRDTKDTLRESDGKFAHETRAEPARSTSILGEGAVSAETLRNQSVPATERFDLLVKQLQANDADYMFDNDSFEQPGPDAQATFDEIRGDIQAVHTVLEAAADELDHVAGTTDKHELMVGVSEAAYDSWQELTFKRAKRANRQAA